MVKILNVTQLVPQKVPRITTRVHAQDSLGVSHTAVWGQWIDPPGFIPLHYHDTEEVIAILSGCLVLRMADEDVRLVAQSGAQLDPVRRITHSRDASEPRKE